MRGAVPAVEPGDTVLDGIARRQQQNGRPDFLAAQLPADREAVEPGQHHVKHDHVERCRLGHPDGVLTARGDVSRVALFAQASCQEIGELSFVLHDEHAHGLIVA